MKRPRSFSPVLVIGFLVSAPLTAHAQCDVARFDQLPVVQIGGMDAGRLTLQVDQPGIDDIRVFEAQASGWTLVDAFPHPAPSFILPPALASHGSTVAIGEDAAGAPLTVHVRAGSGPLAALRASDSHPEDAFGSALALHGDVLVIGANQYTQSSFVRGPGKAYVFERSGGVWTEVAILLPHDLGGYASGPVYGRSIDTDGETIVVGSDRDGQFGSEHGAAYVYERGPAGWFEAAKLVASDAGDYRGFGTSVSIAGERLLVGSPRGSDSVVYAFERRPSGWTETQVLIPSDSAPFQGFGSSIDMDGGRAVVGRTSYYLAGALYVFEHGSPGWSETVFLDQIDVISPNLILNTLRPAVIDGNQVIATVLGASGALSEKEALLLSLGIDRAQNYCPPVANSTGNPGRISIEGCDSRSANAMVLVASDLPAARLGLFFHGQTPAQIPAGNGFRCVGSRVQRLGNLQSDAGGTLRLALDFNDPRARVIPAGVTWHFQAYFRDSGQGAGFNFSDAIAVEIQP